ncbi:MAG: phospho-N-acetylmuramoyl-pentapeptide-transferase [Clostridiales bacterium]|nr:phospho-N-acetylmuramoyl-pentapeptide-transferase [Clostridiales bacterium]
MKAIIAGLIAFSVSCLLTKLEIPMLRRLRAGQSIREDGPESHLSKAGTPTMGGLSMIATAVLLGLIFSRSKDMIIMMLSTLAFGFVGFADDWLKVVQKRNLGLSALQKIALQLVFSSGLAYFGYSRGASIMLPFGGGLLNMGGWYIPFAIFMILAMVNAVNLTDGLDGLASSVTAIVACCFAVITEGDISLFFLIISGCCLGFLVFNRHPAKLFMGDTGSMALGGALAAGAICSNTEAALPIAGGIYVIEALSVIIQVIVFQTCNGKRFFRMSPLHHHFEMGGWSEIKVVGVFSLVTGLLGGLTILMFRG